MHPKLQAIADEFRAAQERLRALATRVPAVSWPRRADPARWSIAECIIHLNLTSAAYRPLVAAALEEGEKLRGAPPRSYRRDFSGWLLWMMVGPPVRMRMKTLDAFVPSGTTPPAAEIVLEFERLQAMQIAWVAAADGLPLAKLRITSPFNARLKYNLFSCLSILPRHQHRHFWQAEQVAAALGLGATASL
ncbi:MAG: DinB family protein [Planctomycetes bacterium]|nr:DinB family protein [Planctomycetota bacterium]